MKRVGRQGLVKRRVEDRHLRDTGEPGSGNFYAEEIGRVVERGQRYQAADSGNYLIVDQGRLPEEFSAVNHAMADAEKLRLVLQDPVFAVHVCHEVERVPVIRQPLRTDLLVERPVSFEPSLTQTALTAPYLLDESCREHDQVRYAENLILDGRAPAVHNSDFHGLIPHP